MKQCQWCLKVYNISKQEWEQTSAERLPWASIEICPECNEKNEKIRVIKNIEEKIKMKETASII